MRMRKPDALSDTDLSRAAAMTQGALLRESEPTQLG
jgi:hypothetical protein